MHKKLYFLTAKKKEKKKREEFGKSGLIIMGRSS